MPSSPAASSTAISASNDYHAKDIIYYSMRVLGDPTVSQDECAHEKAAYGKAIPGRAGHDRVGP